MPEKYLPLGTVCLLKDANKKVIITGFCVRSKGSNGPLKDYMACLYPEGVIAKDQNILFNHDQIDKIVFMGYSNEEDKEFKSKFAEILKSVEIKQEENDKIFDMNTPVATFIFEE